MEKITGPMNRDLTAAYLSVVPGLGHLFKHQKMAGLGIMLVGTPLVILVSGLMAIATLGISLIAGPIAWWGWVAWNAHEAEDQTPRRKPAENLPAPVR